MYPNKQLIIKTMELFQEIDIINCLLPVAGFIVGMLGPISGGGGGFVFMPFFTLLMDMPAQSAVLNTLLATIPVCLVGSMRNYKNGYVSRDTVLSFALFGIIGATLGAVIARVIGSSILKTVFGIYAIIIAFNIAASALVRAKRTVYGKCCSHQPGSQKSLSSWIYGISAGMITGAFGTSGTGPVMAGLFNLQIPLKTVIGTSLFIILVNTMFASGVHLLSGGVNLAAIGLITAGSVPGSVIGTKILASSEIDKYEPAAKYIYAVVIAIIGLMMIWGGQ